VVPTGGGGHSPAVEKHLRTDTESVDLHPAGDRYTDWTPTVDSPAWQRHLNDLARLADARRRKLGEQVVEDRPQWAIEALGRVPVEDEQRDAWIERAASVAAHRELTGNDDTTEALPGPPKQGQVEAYASWRAAWRALGRDEASRAEAEMSDGQLRARVRAYQREEAWAPNYVAPELSGTKQAARRHRGTAEVRAAEAATASDEARRAQLEREALQAGALADVLDRQAAQLEKADEIRAHWYAHTAATRAAEQRARVELSARGVDPDADDRDTNAEQWLAAHRADQAAEDQHRKITDEHDLRDVAQEREAAHRVVEPEPSVDAAETNLADVRDQAAADRKREPRAPDNWTRVPTAEETSESITRAQRALAELEARRAQDERRAHDEARARQLTDWHHRDRAADARNNERDRDVGRAR
jgi:hypothetical protein